MSFGFDLSISSVVRMSGGKSSGASIRLAYVDAAVKLLTINAPDMRRSVVNGDGLVTFTSYDTDSIINGTTLASNGQFGRHDVPDGYSSPVFRDWIIKRHPDNLVGNDTDLTFAPGNSKLFKFTGQAFEFARGKIGAASLALRWSEDGGMTWFQTYQQWEYAVAKMWMHVDFGSAKERIVEIIGCDQGLQIYGYNFDTGVLPEPFVDPDIPMMAMFGDSYVFGQGSGDEGDGQGGAQYPNKQKGINGTPRKFAEYIGGLQMYHHGLRGNCFSRHRTTMSNFANRISCIAYPEHSEGDKWGPLDLFVIPSTINDDPAAALPYRREDAEDAFRRLRAKQPDALILFPVGARAPHHNEGAGWVDDYKNAFKAVFGETEDQWVKNGAFLHDGTRRDGAAWVPSGAEGSSPYFGAAEFDSGHPSAAGYDYLAQKYSEGALKLARRVVALGASMRGDEIYAGVMSAVGAGWSQVGDTFEAAAASGELRFDSADIHGAGVYAVSVEVSGLSVGSLTLECGGQSEEITSDGKYVVVSNSGAGNFVIRGNGLTAMVSGISCKKM